MSKKTPLSKVSQLSIEKKFDVFDSYSEGLARGHASMIYKELAESFTLSGMGEVVSKAGFMKFWANLRKDIESQGGPKTESCELFKFTNIILRDVSETVTEEPFDIFISLLF